jgi:hypothetical protein
MPRHFTLPAGIVRWAAFGSGFALLLAASLVSNSGIEAFLGRSPGSLSWGPRLFRLLLYFHAVLLIFAAVKPEKNRPVSAASPIARRTWIVLSALTIIGLALRFYRLNTCLWLDEVLTMLDYGRAPFSQIVSSFPNQNQHMLYSLMAHSAIVSFGESAWTLRLPAVLFGAASIWALYLLGRDVVGDTRALVACGLLTVSYHHVWFSQNARGYSGLLFFTLLSSWFWLKAARDPSRRNCIGYAIAASLGVWVHMTMLFVVAGQAFLTFMPFAFSGGRPVARLRLLGAFALAGTITLQLHALALPEFLRSARNEVSMPSEWTSPLWVIAETARSLHVGFGGSIVLACGALFMAAGWLLLLAKQREFALLSLVPVVLGGGLMVAASHNLWPRFFFFAMGFALLILAYGIFEIPNRVFRIGPPLVRAFGRTAGPVASVLLLTASIATLPRCYALPKQDFTGARDFVESSRKTDETVVTVGLAAHAYRYYAPSWKVIETADQLKQADTGRNNLFLVYTLGTELSAFHPELWREITQQFEAVHSFSGTLGGGEVIVCRRRATLSQFRTQERVQQ